MPGAPKRLLVVLALAAALPLTAARPCAARGTGGFLRQWAACGPLEGTRLDTPELSADFAGYPGLFAAGGVWLPVETEPEGRLDLRALYPGPPSGTALLHAFFEIPADGTYRFRIGSDDAVRVDIDGRTVHRNDVRRAWRADQDRIEVHLARGWHRMLVRVVDYGGEWAVSVRAADAKDQPLDLAHQAACPRPMEAACRLAEAVTVGERADVATFLGDEVTRLIDDLDKAIPRLAEAPEGYVTFAEYEGARNLGRVFFESLVLLWRESVGENLDAEAFRAAQHMATEAARGFSEVLAQETDRIARSLVRQHRVWETLGGEALAQRDLAAATLEVADLLARSRRLAARIESERIQAARLENDIRNFRQRDVAVRVLDPEGGAVAGADVEIVQQRHDFLFGCNLFAFHRWDDDKKNDLYERRFRSLFNLATVPLYWSVIEKRRGRPDFERLDDALRWCAENGIQVKAHPLLWGKTTPRWLEDLSADQARDAVAAHLRQTIERYRTSVAWWDVIHEPAARLRIGAAEIEAAQAMRWAAEARPDGGLLVSGDDAQALAEVGPALAAARLDGVGITLHQHAGVWPLDQVRQTLDRAAASGRPVHVAAVTILGDPETEAEQAEAVRHFYTAAFAHPKVASIVWWDLSDRFAWQNAPAGLVRADLAPKPAYRVLDRLINHLWRTDAAGRTDADGTVRVRAFFGAYRISAHCGGRKATLDVHLGRDGPKEVKVVLPPAR
ncbi:MAG TPA: endo-1,4-beta-xylanase [Phycisphaerae bacterium]|nr:endo-1,4-beta-xylanase [Phycisphaerae bacterium]